MKRLRAIIIAIIFFAIFLIPVLYELDQKAHEVPYSAMYEYFGTEVIQFGTTDDRDPKCDPSIGFEMDLVEGSCKIVFK